jgi:hypothetical protein
MRVPR